jgi:hypothetical protein
MSDMSFEQNFGKLADAQLNEKLPSLMDKRVGFQVIDKNEDETLAVGVAAFVLSSVWLYIPVFFINGVLKGFELLYIQQQDKFVPAMDNWISVLSEQGVTALGQGQDEGAAMYQTDMFASPEGTNVFTSDSELGKTASFNHGSLMSKEAFERMVSLFNTKDVPTANLLEDLPSMGKEASQVFLNTLLNRPDFANAMLTVYPIDEVEKLAASCAEVVATSPFEKQDDKVQFITDMTSKEAKDLDDASKKLLMRNSVFIRDDRTNFSKIYHEEVDSSVISCPTSSGIYDVFLADGNYETMIILFPQCYSGRGSMFTSSAKRSNVGRPVSMIRLDQPTKFVRAQNKDVFCKPAVNISKRQVDGLEGGTEATLRALVDLPDGTDLLFVQSPTRVIETRLCKTKETPDNKKYITVENTPGCYAGEGYGRGMHESIGCNDDDVSGLGGKLVVEFVGKAARLQVRGDCLYIPEGTRLFIHQDKWVADKPNQKWYQDEKKAEKKSKTFVLGKPETIYEVMHKQAGLNRIEVFASGGNAEVKGAEYSTGLIDKNAALEHLIRDHGIFAGQAVNILKEAARKEGGRYGFFIKHAGAYDSAAYGLADRPFMGGPSGQEEYAVKSSLQTNTGNKLTGPKSADNSSMLPQEAVDRAVNASKAGIKEVFDTSVLSGLVDKADVSDLRRDYVADMVKGMDKIGRMLFLYYWHNDEFEDRYGKEDLQKLEDTLKDVFISTGDLVLFLKEKTAYTPDTAQSLFGSLSEDVGSAAVE